MKQTLSKAEYEAYLQSYHWKAVRKGALARAEHRCQLCYSAKSLQVHHRTYERLNAERDTDVIALCRKCHHHFHGVDGGPKRHLSRPPQPKKGKKRKYKGGGKNWNTPKHRRPSSRMVVTYSSGESALFRAAERRLDETHPRTDAIHREDIDRRGVVTGQSAENHAEKVT